MNREIWIRHCDCRVAMLLAVTASVAIHVGEPQKKSWIATAFGLAMTGRAEGMFMTWNAGVEAAVTSEASHEHR